MVINERRTAMTKTLEMQFTPELVAEIKDFGYDATQDPRKIPSSRGWLGMIGGPKYRPDILVQQGDKFVLVETKVGPVLLGSVIKARNYADHYNAGVVLCVPDESLIRTPQSVKEFAQDNHIILCSKSEIEETLEEIFN